MLSSTISPEPDWNLPPDTRLEHAKPGPQMLRCFEAQHRGLREVRLIVCQIETADGVQSTSDDIQRLHLETKLRAKPPVSAETLCRITWLRGEQYVRLHRHKTQFRVHLVGTNDDGRFNKQTRFTILPDDVIAESIVDENADAPADADAPPADGNQDDSFQGHDDDGEWNKEPKDTDKAPNAMMPIETVVEPITGVTYPVPMGINPEFVSHIQKGTLDLAHRAYSGPMRENRILVHEMCKETTDLLTGMKGFFKMLLTKQIQQAEHENTRHDKMVEYLTTRMTSLEKQQMESNRLSAKQYENLQELAKQGWVAFLDAMKMKEKVVDDQIEINRQRAEELEQVPAPAAAPADGGFSKILKDAGENPLLIGGLAMVMRKAGNNDGADFLEELARNASKKGTKKDTDDDDEFEDDDDPVDVDAHEKPGSNGEPRAPFVGQPTGPSAPPPTPVADRARRFRASLDKEKLAAMRKLLPKAAWNAFVAASEATDDMTAIAAIRTLRGFVEGSVTIMVELGTHLTEDQVVEITDLVKDVGKPGKPAEARTPPRKPPPRPGPSTNP